MDEILSYKEACKLLGVSHRRLKWLIEHYRWHTEDHLLDARKKTLRRAAVETLRMEALP